MKDFIINFINYMETRIELENKLEELIVTADYLWCNDRELKNEILKLIPLVLNSVLPDMYEETNYLNNVSINEIKQKAKEKFNIDL